MTNRRALVLAAGLIAGLGALIAPTGANAQECGCVSHHHTTYWGGRYSVYGNRHSNYGGYNDGAYGRYRYGDRGSYSGEGYSYRRTYNGGYSPGNDSDRLYSGRYDDSHHTEPGVAAWKCGCINQYHHARWDAQNSPNGNRRADYGGDADESYPRERHNEHRLYSGGAYSGGDSSDRPYSGDRYDYDR